MQGGKREGAGRKKEGRIATTIHTTVEAKKELIEQSKIRETTIGKYIEFLIERSNKLK